MSSLTRVYQRGVKIIKWVWDDGWSRKRKVCVVE